MKCFLFAIAFVFLVFSIACNEQANTAQENSDTLATISPDQNWTQDQLDVKARVEEFLVVAGNFDLDKMDSMITDKANIGIGRFKDGKWGCSVINFDEYRQDAEKKTLQPYYETVANWDIRVNEGQLAFVYADAILHKYGVPTRHNKDYFTLIKENDNWKFLNLSFTTQLLPEEIKKFNIDTFALSYAQAWSGIRPGFVASFFAEDGSLQINDGAPAKGRAEIEKVAQGFMRDLPGMLVRYDSLVTTNNKTKFHWTLIATNSGPGGTGNKVNVSGYESWEISDDGLIKKSMGSFPSEEYQRQLHAGKKE